MSTEPIPLNGLRHDKAPEAKAALPQPTTVVYACSGCSDAGELADRIARRLTREGLAQMSCLAGIGGRVKSLVAKAESAERILVIDGCPLACARKTLQLAGFNEFQYLGLHHAGLRKGACPVTEQNLEIGLEAARQVLREQTLGDPQGCPSGVTLLGVHCP